MSRENLIRQIMHDDSNLEQRQLKGLTLYELKIIDEIIRIRKCLQLFGKNIKEKL